MKTLANRKEFDRMVDIISDIKDYIELCTAKQIPDKFSIELKKVFRDFFPDYVPTNVFISNNIDKEFFGVYIRRCLRVNRIFVNDIRNLNEEPDYIIDIDSKLFELNLSPTQIASLIIYDMYYILSNNATLDLISAIDAICAGRDEVTFKNIIKYEPMEKLFNFCAADYIYRKYSIFTHDKNELVRIPEILTIYGVDSIFMEGVNELFMSQFMVGKTYFPHPSLALNWCISIASRYEPKSTEALDVLNDFIVTTGSELIKNGAYLISKSMVDLNVKYQNKAALKEASLFTSIRKNGMKSLENDLFEYEMRVKNIDDENSAIFLMRQINSRMSIISDYLDNEKISEAEMKRWQMLYDRYDKLRIKMTNKPIYSKKMYGLFVDYNALMQPGSENMMTMNTMY